MCRSRSVIVAGVKGQSRTYLEHALYLHSTQTQLPVPNVDRNAEYVTQTSLAAPKLGMFASRGIEAPNPV